MAEQAGVGCGVLVTTALCLLLHIIALIIASSPVDYWSDNFDEGANCKNTELINGELKPKEQCESIETSNDTQAALHECKTRLHRKLLTACAATKIKTAGALLYCKVRSLTECCFANHSCTSSWTEINKNFGNETAKVYLRNKEKFLVNLEKMGYKKCHHIEGLNASQCALDCKQAELDDFAKNCTEQGGLFKCCIRRDKMDCHECRFCCSLPICTLKTPLGVQNRGVGVVLEQDQQNEITATEIFNIRRRMYKTRDSRCLKPDDTKPPSEWAHYEHEEFKKAATKEELDKVSTIAFDPNFMNFDDPEVFERFVGPDYQKYWKETYGFDRVTKLEGNITKTNTSIDYDDLMNSKFCLEAEFSPFGKKCRKNRGFFKCCLKGFSLNVFERLRRELANEKLIEPPKKLFCGEDNLSLDCYFAVTTHMCTTKDPLTGALTTEFETPPQPKFNVGGTPSFELQWSGFRTDFCQVLYTCQNMAHNFNLLHYERAADKDSLCHAAGISLAKDVEGANLTKPQLEQLDIYCKKQKLSSVILCEDEAKFEGPRAALVTKDIKQRLKDMSLKQDRKKKKSKKGKKKSGKKTKEDLAGKAML